MVVDDNRTKWIVISIAGFAAWGLISAFWADSTASVWNHTVVWAEYLLYFIVFRNLLARSAGISVVTGTFIWLILLISILCFIDFVTVPDFQALGAILRIRYAKFAEMLVTLLPVVWIAAAYSRKRGKFLFLLLAASAGWITVMLSLSKGAFLAGIAGTILMFAGSLLFGEQGPRKRLLCSLAIWIAITISFQAGFSLFSSVPSTTDLISGKADPTRESSLSRVFIWEVGKQMFVDHPLIGVGADNFGDSFNSARASYRSIHPNEPSDERVSDSLVERAHNELLQVAGELGIVGLVLFLIPFGIFVVWVSQSLLSRKFRISAMFWGSLGGITAFGVSSMVSSFSFRLTQNGIVFVLVFLIALNELRKSNKGPNGSRGKIASHGPARALRFAFIALVLSAMFATSLLKAVAEYIAILGDQAEDTTSAMAYYGRARQLDPDYTATYLRGAGRTFADKDYRTAAEQMSRAIDDGYGVVLNYSVLAECFEETGDLVSAEATFSKALKIYPNSVFLQVRYSLFLENAGRKVEADAQMGLARSVEPRQAAGWRNLIRDGSVSAFYAARNDPAIALPAELIPDKAVVMYLDKTPETSPPQ